MAKDIVPELLDKIKKDFHLSTSQSEVIKKAIDDLDLGKATYKTANSIAKELGDVLAKTLQSNINADVLPDGKMYYNIANRILNDTMRANYEAVAEFSKDVQTSLNHSAGLGIRGRKAELNQDRIDGLVERISESEDIDFIKKTLGEPIVNFTQSIVDDTIKTNADFHDKLGLKPKIIRTSTGKCCNWCSKVAGTYDYKDVKNTGNDVFRRHQHCRCEIDYHPGDGRKQNVHTKKWKDTALDNIGNIKTNNLQHEYKISDIIAEKALQERSDKVWNKKLLGSEQNALYEYSDVHYGITNRYLRDALEYGDDIVFNQTEQRIKELDRVLSKNVLGDDLILYRGVSVEEFNDWINSKTLNTYKSSSLSEDIFNIFGDGHRIVIHAPKNTKGFYLGNHSEFKSEKEFLLHRGQSYRVLSNENGILEVEIDE